MTRKRSTRKGVVEDVLCSDSSVKKWGFKIHIGGKVIHEPTLEYVGGESYDNDVSPKGFNLEVLEDIIEKSDSDVGRNDNVVVAVHEDEVVVHEEEVAVHDMPMAGHNVDNDVAVIDVGENDEAENDMAVNDVPENDVEANDVPENDVAVNDVPENDVPQNDVPQNDMPENDMPQNDVPQNDVSQNDVSVSDGTDGSEENWSDVAGFDGATDGFDGSDVDDVSVGGISFCSDIEDEELVSLITQANNLTETAATHGPEKDAIRQNRRVTNANNSDEEYEVGPDYMEDSNLNWSLTEDEDDVANINGEGEVNSAQVGVDEEEIPHTEMDGRYKKVRTLTLYGLKLDNVHAGYGIYKWYNTEMYKELYRHQINPMASEKFWKSTNTQPLVPPPARKKLGRPKEKRIPEPGEGGTSTKASRKGRRMRCNLCKVIGHNKRTCPLKGDEEALAASVAAYYASIGKVPVQASTGPSAPPIAEGVPEAGPSVPSSAVPEQPKRKKVNLTIGLSKQVSTVPVVAVPTVPVEAPTVPVEAPTVPVQATTVPVQATTTTVPVVPVVAPFMRGPKLVKKRKAGDVLGQISKKPWK
ncbi:hypothetical protein ACFE04_019349 [Oxalis oulophora]